MLVQRRIHPLILPALAAALAATLASCAKNDASPADDTIVVFNAGSLARPLRAALDSFTAGTKIKVEQENAGSVETARKLTELHRIPDLVGSADYQIFPKYLMPGQTSWYARFARNRMVLMYTPKSKFASTIDSTNWYRILETKGVQTGRADPALDPNGYRSVIVMKLAEQYYKQPGLTDRLIANSSAHVVRPKEVDLMGLLQAGEIDYAWSYESVAQAAKLPYVTLPRAIDLSDPARAADYARATVKIPGNTIRDSVEIKGEPILYAFTVPRNAPHKALGERFAAFLVSDTGKRIIAREHLDPLPVTIFVGDSIPPIFTEPRSTASH
ncbi:MAG TPA: extracellular solute-binding protein [Gemmatimonadaceae bacterium]|nr:extracellular solute-binding protein [Gemmatimonadaceae bacterium]